MNKIIVLLIFGFLGSNCNSGLKAKRIEQYCGLYELDVEKSIFSEYELIDYKGLLLDLKCDKKFSFSREVPFVRKQNGKWDYEVTLEGGGICTLIYGNFEEDQVNLRKSIQLEIDLPIPKSGFPQAKKLVFQKQLE